MLVRNNVMPPMRPKMLGKNETQNDAWINDVGSLTQLEATTRKEQVAAVGFGGYGPLEYLLKDDSVTEVTCIGPRRTYVERNGLLEEVPCYFEDERRMLRVIEHMLYLAGQRLQPGWPIMNVRLPDGVQLNVVLPPSAVNGPTITLRKGVKEPLTLAELVRGDTLSQAMADVLRSCVEGRLNIVICGSQNSGRTTLLNALCAAIPNEERIITIEESAELRLHQRQVIGLVAQAIGPQVAGRVTLRDLLTNALHMGPERIVLGECRGEEVLEMLQALYTGYNGSLMTVYAKNTQNCLTRLETMCLAGSMPMSIQTLQSIPTNILRRQMADSLDVIVHVSRMPDGSRKITDIAEVLSAENDELKVQSIFSYRDDGLDRETGKAAGHFEPRGVCPAFLTKLAVMDIELPQETFI